MPPKNQYKVIQGGGSQDLLGKVYRDGSTGQLVRQAIPPEQAQRIVSLSNIPPSYTEAQIIDDCSTLGQLSAIQIFKHKYSSLAGKPKGTGLIEFSTPDAALKAVEFFDKKIIKETDIPISAHIYDETDDDTFNNKEGTFAGLKQKYKDFPSANASDTLIDHVPSHVFLDLVNELDSYCDDDNLPIFGLEPLYKYMTDQECKDLGITTQEQQQYRTESYSQSISQTFQQTKNKNYDKKPQHQHGQKRSYPNDLQPSRNYNRSKYL